MEKKLLQEAIKLLKQLIQTQSFSGEEDKTATIIEKWLAGFTIKTNRHLNNVWATNKYFDADKPSILLNSHHDTVKPNSNYTKNPFDANVIDGKIYGLGSNDAGGCLVSLIAVFIHYYEQENLEYNLILAATAEEEISGENGISSLLEFLPTINFAVIGEPTEMNLAIAEKGLMVVDAFAKGVSGHAAHENTENAIYTAIEDINWIRNYQFPIVSDTLGKVKMSVTQINAGSQHNVIPAVCHFVIDVRVNDAYQNEEVFVFMKQNIKSKLEARSFRLNSSFISENHPIVQAGLALNRKTYGSPTISDQALLSCPSLKLGPGKSSRSHNADEFIEIAEIEKGMNLYISIFNQIL